jgi:hypothetical protein
MYDLWWTQWHWACFLWVFQFPLPILIPPIAPQSSSSIIRGWDNRPNSSLSTKWTQVSPRGGKKKLPFIFFWSILHNRLTIMFFRDVTPCSIHRYLPKLWKTLLPQLLDPEDLDSMFLWNVGEYLPDYTASRPRRHWSSQSSLLKPQTSNFISRSNLN